MKPSVAAAIIAGGAGRRQGGRDKTSLLVAGTTILERQTAVLTPLFSRIILVLGADVAPGAAPKRPQGLTVVHDRPPAGQGPLAGIDAALSALTAEETAVLCVAGDMPLLAPALLILLRDAAPEAAALVPKVDGRPQPLLARYDRRCAAPIAAARAEGRLKAAAVLDELDATWLEEPALRAVDPALLSFENANTPEDLVRIEALARAAARTTQG